MDATTTTAAAVDLADPHLFADPGYHRLFRHLRENDPVHWNPEAAEPGFWSVTRYEDCQAVQRDDETFSSTGTNVLGQQRWTGDDGSGRMLTHTDGPRHTELRQVVNRSFTPRAVASLESYLRAVVGRALDEALDAGEVDFVETVSLLPVASIAAVLGVPREDWPLLLRLTTAAFGSADQDYQTSPSARASAAHAHAQLLLYCQDLMETRRRDPADDVATRLVEAQDAGVLTEEDAMMFFDLLILGGNETTRHGAVGALLAFTDFPDQWRLLRADRGLLPSAVAEVLRYVSPSKHVLRRATRHVELHGRTIRAGQDVAVWHFSANRDERVFERPDVFDITRGDNPHLGLGSGRHYCLGASLALMELRLFLDELCTRVASAEVVEPPQRLASTVISGFKRLRVRLRSA
ncbi:cytochrome P450 [Streptomyces odontomachi]|uniref:cytochrome P450 n=1 Tax=Streptomyces odontomachi TaxID=2944940 RepID=UPI0021087AD3|nr:cytochrome P450 [Streptomyces sp. ODS25]